jgi:hypothetical protein
MGVHDFEAHEQSGGRQRYFLVKTLCMFRTMLVTAASVQHRDATQQLLDVRRGWFFQLRLLWVDQADSGDLAAWIRALRPWQKIYPAAVKRLGGIEGFHVIPNRGVLSACSRDSTLPLLILKITSI